MGIYRLPNGLVREFGRTRLHQGYGVAGEGKRNVQMAKAMRGRIALTLRLTNMRVLIFVFLMLVPVSLFGAAKSGSVPQLSGYKAVRVRYGPMNKMIIPVTINGQPANLLVDTGSNQLILDADAASSFGIRPSQRGLRYLRFT